jgi:hypothetical protein
MPRGPVHRPVSPPTSFPPLQHQGTPRVTFFVFRGWWGRPEASWYVFVSGPRMSGQSPCIPRNPPTHAFRQRAPQNHGAQHPPYPHSPTPIPTSQPPAPGIRLVVCPHDRDRIPNMPYLQEAYSPSTLPHERGGLPSNMHKLPKIPASPTRKALESSKRRSQHRQTEQGQRDAIDRTSYKLNERVQAIWQGGRDLWNGMVTAISDTRTKTYTITYDDGEVEEGVSLDLILPAPDEPPQDPAVRTTDPRFPADGDIILTPMELRRLWTYQPHLPDQRVWATTSEVGFPLEEENEEIQNERDEWEGKQTARFLHPAISDMDHLLNGIENQGQNLTKTQRAVIQLDSDWMNPTNDPHAVKWHRKWEKNPSPPRTKDPPRIRDYQEQSLKLGSTFHLDHPHPHTTEYGIIHIEVESKTWIDNHEGTEIFTRAGLSTSTDLTRSFTILCGTC